MRRRPRTPPVVEIKTKRERRGPRGRRPQGVRLFPFSRDFSGACTRTLCQYGKSCIGMEPYPDISVTLDVETDAKNAPARTGAALVSSRQDLSDAKKAPSRSGAALVSRQESLCAGR